MMIEHDQASDTKRWQLDRKLSKNFSLLLKALPVNKSTTIQFLLFPYDGAPYIEERHSSFLET